MNIRNWILGCAGVASLGAVWVAAAGRKPAGSTPGEMPFRLGRVRAQDLQVSVREAGVVDPATKVDVKAAVSGRVRFVAPAAEVVEKVRVFKVEVALDHLEDSLRTGMSANVEILGDRREDAVSVPLEALHRRDGQAVAPASVALAWLAALGMAVAFGLYPALRAMGQSPATARR